MQPCRPVRHPRLFVAALAMATVSLTQATTMAKPPRAKPDAAPVEPAVEPQWLTGVLEGFNFSPRGDMESFMLKEGGQVTQVVFPPDASSAIVETVTARERIRVMAVPERSVALHPVYRLVSLTAKNGQQLTLDRLPRKGKPPQPQTREGERPVHVDATVKQLNYGRRGEVNGVQIERGDFVHLGPEVSTRLALAVGHKLSIDGIARPMMRGRSVIEATMVNGLAIPKRPGPKDNGPGKKTPVAAEQVPAAAMETLRKQAGGAEFSKLEAEKKDDRDLYVGKWMGNDREYEAKVTGDGALLELKEPLSVEDLPDAVRNAVGQAFPNATDWDSKKRTIFSEGQPSVVYEIKVRDGGQKGPPLRVSPDGTIDEHRPGPKPKPDKGGDTASQ
jgi:hypothetical protein